MPGVITVTATRSGPVDPNKPPSGQWFVVGQTERGPVNAAVQLNGMADYDLFFGARVSYGALYDAVKCFFDEGGATCIVGRVVGPGATAGFLQLMDRATTPVPTMKVTANSPGAWSANLQVVVLAGLIANTFRIQILLNGVIVEDYNNLTSPANAVARLAVSNYVVATDLGSATAAPNNNPAIIAATALSAGSDDRTNVNTTVLTNGLALFSNDLGVGAVSIPGQGATVHSAIIAHCQASNRIGILATAQGATKTDLLSLVGTQNTPYAGIFHPWVEVSDGAGGEYTISPEGFVAAVRAKAHITGAWVIPAGKKGQAVSLLDLDQIFSTDDANDLDTAGISVIRSISGTIRLYGYRSLSTDTTNYFFLTIQDLLNYITFKGQTLLEDYTFDPVDAKGHLLSAINADLVGIVDPIAQAGGLYGTTNPDGTVHDPGYSIDTSTNVNTPTTLSTNTVKAVVAVRPSPSAATIILELVRVGFNAPV